MQIYIYIYIFVLYFSIRGFLHNYKSFSLKINKYWSLSCKHFYISLLKHTNLHKNNKLLNYEFVIFQ